MNRKSTNPEGQDGFLQGASNSTQMQGNMLGWHSLFGCQTDFRLPRPLEKQLINRRLLIAWVGLFMIAFALAPGFFPQMRELIVLADTGLEEKTVRAFLFFGGSIVLTWLIERGWSEDPSDQA